MLDQMDDAKKVRDFWFGKTPLAPDQLPRRMDLWFAATPEIAAHRRRRLAHALRGAGRARTSTASWRSGRTVRAAGSA